MAELRMKKVISVLAVAGLSILAILVSIIIGCKERKFVTTQQRTGPPVIVVGGSIEGQTYGSWTQHCGTTNDLLWCSGTNGGTDFLTSYLYDPAINTPSIPPHQSWKIHISDKNPNNQNTGVDLCGNSGCNQASDSDPNNVYLKPSKDNKTESGWDTSKLPDDISYIDKTCNSMGNCEHPVSATLYINNSKVSESKCVAPNLYGCFISVGQPTVRKH